jgi:hypothetical protein
VKNERGEATMHVVEKDGTFGVEIPGVFDGESFALPMRDKAAAMGYMRFLESEANKEHGNTTTWKEVGK